MAAPFFVIAVVCMICGHIFKVKRLGLFISIYEKPIESNLLNAMTLGHTLNVILPIRLGDIIRVIWSGRKLKNGYSFALATVVADLYVDVITVGAMFAGLSLIGKGGEQLLRIAHIYMRAFLVIIPLTVLCALARKQIKKMIGNVAGIFNEAIEFRVLYVSYLCIASVKDIVNRISKVRFLSYSIGIWTSYVISYAAFAEAVQRYGFYYSTSDVFTKMFSVPSLYHIEKELVLLWGAYLILPLFICFPISLAMRKSTASDDYCAVLPQGKPADKLAFLKTYYADENREHIQAYLQLNQDVTILEDYSAGSNASTVLVMKPDGNLFFRKYAFDADGIKLQEQINWIERHQFYIPLPIVVDRSRGSNYVTYDMHSYGSAVGLFRYIHTMPLQYSWNIIKSALDDIRAGLHSQNIRPADPSTIDKYISSKVENNLRFILEENKYIKQLEQNDAIIVNGIPLQTLGFYKQMFSRQHLRDIFRDDVYSEIHGDLTVENIVCLGDSSEINRNEYIGKVIPKKYYYIDPNTGNVHDSPFLDYGKLLQSLHGNYEFLMTVSSVNIDKKSVNFLMIKSEAYGKIYEVYKEYLRSVFSESQILSIYYHEIIHWLRLIPYKTKKDEKLSVVFYTGLLTVLKDVWGMEHAPEEQIGHI